MVKIGPYAGTSLCCWSPQFSYKKKSNMKTKLKLDFMHFSISVTYTKEETPQYM